MAGIAAIVGGLETRLKTLSGLQTFDHIPETLDPPAAAVVFDECDFDSTMSRGTDDLRFMIHVFTSTADAKAGQRKLYRYIDGSAGLSVKAAIEGDPTLGGLAMYATVERAEDFGIVQVGAMRLYSVKFPTVVSVSGIG